MILDTHMYLMVAEKIGCEQTVEGESKEKWSPEEKKEIYRAIAEAQLDAWKKGSGYFYWSCKLLTDTVNTSSWVGWDIWD